MRFLLLGLVLSSSALCHASYCDRFEALGEILVIRPKACDLGYTIIDDRPVTEATANEGDAFLPSGKYRGICTDYEFGFRIGMGYQMAACCCADWRVTYTGLWTSRSEQVAAEGDGGLWITFAHPRYSNHRLNNASVGPVGVPGAADAFAQGRVRVDYNMVDGVIGARSQEGCRLWRRGYVGLRWAQIALRQEAHYEGTFALSTNDFQRHVGTTSHRTESWGIGPRLGYEARYELGCCFGLVAQVGGSLLAGENCTHMKEDILNDQFAPTPVTVVEPLDVRSRKHCQVFPEFDTRLGVSYILRCRCFTLFIEVGWEFVTYLSALPGKRFNQSFYELAVEPDVSSAIATEQCRSFNLDGLYVTFLLSL